MEEDNRIKIVSSIDKILTTALVVLNTLISLILVVGMIIPLALCTWLLSMLVIEGIKDSGSEWLILYFLFGFIILVALLALIGAFLSLLSAVFCAAVSGIIDLMLIYKNKPNLGLIILFNIIEIICYGNLFILTIYWLFDVISIKPLSPVTLALLLLATVLILFILCAILVDLGIGIADWMMRRQLKKEEEKQYSELVIDEFYEEQVNGDSFSVNTDYE